MKSWYFVCDCGAKFFHAAEAADCPRCGKLLESGERMEPPWKLLTVAEAAEYLNCSARTVRKLLDSGLVSYHRCPGVRVSIQAIEAYLDLTKRTGRGPPLQVSKGQRPRLKHLRLS